MIFILISLVTFKDPVVTDWYKQFIRRIVWFLPTLSKFIFGQRGFLNYYKRAMRITRLNMNQCIKIDFFILWNRGLRGLLSVWLLGIMNFAGNIWRDWRLFWRVACTRICCLCLFRVFYIFFIFFLLTNLETAKISCAISHI